MTTCGFGELGLLSLARSRPASPVVPLKLGPSSKLPSASTTSNDDPQTSVDIPTL